VCTLWESIKITDGKLVVTDYRRLGRFLRLRVLMFHHLYHGMEARSGEIILGNCLCGFMYHHGDLTVFNLLGHNDEWLGAQIARSIGVDDAIDRVAEAVVIAGEHPTESAARDVLFRDQGEEFLGFVEPFKSLTKPATDRFFTENAGTVGTFKKMHPDEAALVEEIHDQGTGKFRGYGLDLKKLGVRSEVRRPLCEFAHHESRLVCV
jgi:hypothetical protein